jgi:hypothetical protein
VTKVSNDGFRSVRLIQLCPVFAFLAKSFSDLWQIKKIKALNPSKGKIANKFRRDYHEQILKSLFTLNH